MRYTPYYLTVFLFLVTPPALGQDRKHGPFEEWDQPASTRSPNPGLTTGHASAAVSETGQINNSAIKVAQNDLGTQDNMQSKEVVKQAQVAFDESSDSSTTKSYAIRFGAGASLIVPIRLADTSVGNKLMSDFSVAWAPFGLVGEIGFDLAIGRASTFIMRPNLKFFFAKHPVLSIYIDCAVEFISHDSGSETGGGAGLGVVMQIIDNLAVELKFAASAYSLSKNGLKTIVGIADTESEDAVDSNLAILPSVSLRALARF